MLFDMPSPSVCPIYIYRDDLVGTQEHRNTVTSTFCMEYLVHISRSDSRGSDSHVVTLFFVVLHNIKKFMIRNCFKWS